MQDSSYMASKSSLLIGFKSSLYSYFCFLDISIIRDLLKFPTTMVGLSIPPVVLLNFYFMCFKAILLDPISLTLCFTGNKILSSVESSFTSNHSITCLPAFVASVERFAVCRTVSCFNSETLIKCMLNLVLASRSISFLFIFSIHGTVCRIWKISLDSPASPLVCLIGSLLHLLTFEFQPLYFFIFEIRFFSNIFGHFQTSFIACHFSNHIWMFYSPM